jgi:hypothetical protein
VYWQRDADIGLVLERRRIITPFGRGRKDVVSIRKIWPWSPAFSSGAAPFCLTCVNVNSPYIYFHAVMSPHMRT